MPDPLDWIANSPVRALSPTTRAVTDGSPFSVVVIHLRVVTVPISDTSALMWSPSRNVHLPVLRNL
jgi:hypothetical protein